MHSLTNYILDVTKKGNVKASMKRYIMTASPYFLAKKVAEFAKICNTNYFDLTEDVKATKYLESIAKNGNKVFLLQSALAPGFI